MQAAPYHLLHDFPIWDTGILSRFSIPFCILHRGFCPLTSGIECVRPTSTFWTPLHAMPEKEGLREKRAANVDQITHTRKFRKESKRRIFMKFQLDSDYLFSGRSIASSICKCLSFSRGNYESPKNTDLDCFLAAINRMKETKMIEGILISIWAVLVLLSLSGRADGSR